MFKTINGGTLPKRQTRYSSGFDVFANEDVVIEAGKTKLVGLGIALHIDRVIDEHFTNHEWHQGEIVGGQIDYQAVKQFMQEYYLELHPRSSLRAKGLIVGVGIIDIDYADEIKMVVHNPICGYEDVEHYEHGTIAMPYGASMFKGELNQAYTINKGDKIGQLILKRHEGYLLPQEYTLDNERMGGFGSSGAR